MNKLTMYIFPLGVLVGGFFFPIAIIIYWLANNAWTLGQQWVVYRRIDREEQEKKQVATAQRQSLAPRPGQKPAAKPKRPANDQPPATDQQPGDDGQSSAVANPAPGAQPRQADDAGSDRKPGTGSGATAMAGDSVSGDVSRETSAGTAPDRRQSENGSQPPQRKQPQRVPPRKNRKRR
jgi:YidC/Oxa1 family membrane protein insertase